MYVQALAILEGPVAEEYGNEMLTICNPRYPTCEVLQRLVDDGYFVLYFRGQKNGVPFAAAAVFEPNPAPKSLEQQSFKDFLRPCAVCETKVSFNDKHHVADKESLEKMTDCLYR